MPDVDVLYLIHHTHTDLGYTHDPTTVWEMHRRFIDTALDACDRDADFRWTLEVTSTLLHWLDHAIDAQVERLRKHATDGRIECTAMFAHLTPLASPAAYAESMRPLARLRRDYGLTIHHAMTNDVNGHNWPLVDVLLDHGVEAFAVSSNDYCGGHPTGRPDLFQWAAPSGRHLLTYNAWHYHTGNYAGVGEATLDTFHHHWPTLRAKLDYAKWPYRFAMLQVTHPFGDNGTADFTLPAFVRRWNAGRRDGEPRLQLATPTDFWSAVHVSGVAPIEERRGDWSDYWNFGAGSCARDTAMSRENESRLLAGDQLHAFVGALHAIAPPADDPIPGRAPATLLSRAAEFRARGWHHLNVWNEHTFDADSSQHSPEGLDTASQWTQKSHLAQEGRSLSQMSQRDGVAELSLLVARDAGDALFLYNPLPWPRTVAGPIDRVLYEPRAGGTDPSSARHHQDRTLAKFIKGTMFLAATELPANGYVIVGRDRLLAEAGRSAPVALGWEGAGTASAFAGGAATQPALLADAETIENGFFRLRFDRARGGIASWVDKRSGRELVDASAGWAFATPAHETVDRDGDASGAFYTNTPWMDVPHRRGWRTDWPAKRGGATRVVSHAARRLPHAIEVTQTLDVAGFASPATAIVTLPDHEPTVAFEAFWQMTSESRPEATYFLLPFAVPGATARVDVGDVPIRVNVDQLAGTNRDFFTAQRWVDFSNDDFGVTIACPLNPLVQLGDFSFARDLADGRPRRAMFLGWVTNNYWPTNFRPAQPGRVTARYVVRPHDGAFDESLAHRHGAEAARPVVMQNAFEPPRPNPLLPRAGSLLRLPGAPFVVSQVIGGGGDGATIDLRITNASDERRTAEVASGDVFAIVGGDVRVDVEPRRTATVTISVTRRA